MRTKDEALEAYKTFEAWATTQHHCKAIKVLRSDRGREYLSQDFNEHWQSQERLENLPRTTHRS